MCINVSMCLCACEYTNKCVCVCVLFSLETIQWFYPFLKSSDAYDHCM